MSSERQDAISTRRGKILCRSGEERGDGEAHESREKDKRVLSIKREDRSKHGYLTESVPAKNTVHQCPPLTRNGRGLELCGKSSSDTPMAKSRRIILGKRNYLEGETQRRGVVSLQRSSITFLSSGLRGPMSIWETVHSTGYSAA